MKRPLRADYNAYMRDYMRERTRKRRAEVTALLGGRCASCGAANDLEVDHIDPATKVSHRFLTWSKDRLAEELAKCQLLCRPCHYKKTAEQRSAQRPRQPFAMLFSKSPAQPDAARQHDQAHHHRLPPRSPPMARLGRAELSRRRMPVSRLSPLTRPLGRPQVDGAAAVGARQRRQVT